MNGLLVACINVTRIHNRRPLSAHSDVCLNAMDKRNKANSE